MANQKKLPGPQLVELLQRYLELVEDNARDSEKPECLHNMRVGLRKLEVFFSLQSDVFNYNKEQVSVLIKAIIDLRKRLGKARDWDVFLEKSSLSFSVSIVPAKVHAQLLAVIREVVAKCHKEIQEIIDAQDYQNFIHSIKDSVQYFNDINPGQILNESIINKVERVFSRHHRKILLYIKDDSKILNMPVKKRHKLRILIKNYCYGLIVVNKIFHCKLKKQIKRAAKVQKILANLRDFNVMADISLALLKEKPDMHSAIVCGEIAGRYGARLDSLNAQFAKRWAKFKKSELTHDDFLAG